MTDVTGSPAGSFPSLAAFRQAHVDLLQRHRTAATEAVLDEVERLIQRGAATGAALAEDAERWEAQGVIDYWMAVLYRARRQPSAGILQPFDPSLAPELADDRCPYLGLAAFREPQHGVFFGRARVVSEMLERLAVGRLLAIVGPSGSGKSSLVLAGLIPALKAGRIAETDKAPGSARWQHFPAIVPGIRPLLSLASLALPADAGTDVRQREASALASDPLRLVRQLDGAGVPAVVVVDQFEEIFTLCTDDTERQAFVDRLLAIAQSPGPEHRVVLTMRSDFYEQIAALPQLHALFDTIQYRIPAFNAAELREVIEKPAELVGLKFEDGIVARLVNEILGEPAGLPLLQFALLKLWERRVRNRVTYDAYQRIGGPLKALERSAEELYGGLLPEEQVTLRRILLRIVRPGSSLEVTSHRVLRESVHGNEPRDRVDRVLDKLIRAGLLRQSGGPDPAEIQVEVAHEALLRNWPRLVEWLEDERVRLRRRFSVTAAARQWVSHGKDPGGLLGGSLLDEARAYDDLDGVEREFIAASDAALRREARMKERRIRVLAALLLIVIVLAAGLWVTVVRLQRAVDRLQQAVAVEQAQSKSLALALDEADRQLRERRVAEAEAAQARQTAVTAVQAASRAVEAADGKGLQDAKDLIRESQKDIAGYASRSGKLPDTKPPPANAVVTRPGASRPSTAGPPVKSAGPSPSAAQPPPAATTAPAGGAEPPASSLLDRVAIRASSEDTGRVVENTTLPLYRFRIWVDAAPDVLARIKRVQYEFDHPTFRQKLQHSDDRRNRFESGYSGWGCLSSVKVTIFPVEAQAPPPVVNFDMCDAVSFRYKK